MKVAHILLGQTCPYDHKVQHDVIKLLNSYMFIGCGMKLNPIKIDDPRVN